ncbi:MAG TPA: phosphate ABC transporter permease subunit PstC [Spirochaetia bacterium]|nr:phosphate ABC transporter permease subunit PstC [Spirochaetia bacterium]
MTQSIESKGGRLPIARASDSAFRALLFFGGIVVSVLLVAILLSLVLSSRPALVANGFRFLTGTEWDPVTNSFHALPFVFGTLITSLLALVIATVLALALSILMGEYFRTGVFASLMRTAVELLAGIPSIVYGFIGLFFLVPVVRAVEIAIGVTPFGVGILTSSILLAFMILPYSASIGREMLSLVPTDLKEAALSLGATRSEMVWKVSLPFARSGILGGVFLSLGRALGETMAVTMVIGNANTMTLNLFSPGNTMASLIANEFSEATTPVYLASLIEIALLLFIISTVINIIGKVVINRMVGAA